MNIKTLFDFERDGCSETPILSVPVKFNCGDKLAFDIGEDYAAHSCKEYSTNKFDMLVVSEKDVGYWIVIDVSFLFSEDGFTQHVNLARSSKEVR